MTISQPHGAEVVFQGRRFNVATVWVRTGQQKQVQKELVIHPGAVVVLPILPDGQVVMIRNFRVSVGRTLWELPAGTLEPPEPPELCAGRELIEETGYRAEKITPLTKFLTSPGICTEEMFAFLATGLTHIGQALEEAEMITVENLPMSAVMEKIQAGEIEDGKTIATLLWYERFGQNRV